MSELDPLDMVATLSECASLWKVDRKTIIWQYWNGHLRMRKSAGVWLVMLQDMVDRFGLPADKEVLPGRG